MRARAPSDENDEHRRLASILFGVPEREVTKQQRQVAKARRHGINYGLQAKRLVDEDIKNGGNLTLHAAERDIRIINEADPWLLEWQKSVREMVMHKRELRNSWGAVWSVPYENLDPHLYSRALAWRPQSECGQLLNLYGFAPLWWHLKKHGIEDVKINLQVHDALVISAPPARAYEVVSLLNQMLTVPRIYDGISLSIPCEFKIGMDWKFTNGYEFKKLPKEKEFTDAAYAVWEKA